MSSMTEDWSRVAYGPKPWAGAKQIINKIIIPRKHDKTNKQQKNKQKKTIRLQHKSLNQTNISKLPPCGDVEINQTHAQSVTAHYCNSRLF